MSRVPDYHLLSSEPLNREVCPVCRCPHEGQLSRVRKEAHARWNICNCCQLYWDPESFLGHSDVRIRDNPVVPAQWETSHRIERVLAGDAGQPEVVSSWRNQWDYIEQQIGSCAKTSFLEIGHGAGEILDYVREKYPTARRTGFEIDADAVAFTRSRGHETFLYDISTGRGDPPPIFEPFDVIYANEVMEHVLFPRIFVERVKKFAHPGTRLWLKFAHPDIAELDWGEWYYWPAITALRLLDEAGWDVLSMQKQPTYHSFVATLKA